MVDPFTAFGAAANIAQFIVYAAQIIKRLDDFHSATKGVPKSFLDLKIQLPLLSNSLEKTRKKIKTGHFSRRDLEALKPVLDRCFYQIQELDRISEEILPVVGDGVLTRARKAVSSMVHERRIATIRKALETYVQLLTLQQVTHAGWPGFRRKGKIAWLTILKEMRLRNV